MFKKWAPVTESEISANDSIISSSIESPRPEIKNQTKPDTQVNTILKGSKLTGNLNITCDIELSGDVEGNITSEHKSNIVIKGTCRGNITTNEGNVDINGQLLGGNIIAGNNVTVSGKFTGGEIKAKGRVYVNGEFSGKLEGNEVEIGPNARGKGEILYKDYISIAKGAKIEAQVSQLQSAGSSGHELRIVKNSPSESKKETLEDIKIAQKEAGKGK